MEGHFPWRRFLAPGLLLAVLALAYATGLNRYISLQALIEHHGALQDYASTHMLFALLAFMAVYVLAVAVSFPGASLLTIVGGLLFGWWMGSFAAVVAATFGATLLFEVVRRTGVESLLRKAGPRLQKLREGFTSDAFSYMLFLRLAPAFPFWLVNIAPAIFGVKRRIFILATAIGIVPGTLAYAAIGSGLGSVLSAEKLAHDACLASQPAEACPYTLSLHMLVTRQLVLALVLLSLVALLPVLIRKFRKPPA